MRLRYIEMGWILAVKELLRNRIALIFILLIPSLFFTLIVATTSDRPILFKLASISEATVFEVGERKEALIFMGLATIAFISSFLGLNLVQKHPDVDRRLVLCGYRSSELIISKMGVLFCVICLIGGYVILALLHFLQPKHLVQALLGLILGGYVYGCYGLLAGAIFRRELEGVLSIVLLVNIDAGWLQNPIFYAEAQNKVIIRYLPAYFPSQASMVAIFTDYSMVNSAVGSMGYGTFLLVFALMIYWGRMRLTR